MCDIIRREEPGRWRRHIVRRHVVSEEPRSEFKVGDIDKEAPIDEYGVFAVVGRLSRADGACASARGVEQHISQEEKTEGLINKLLAVDVVEVYSPPRVTLEAKSVG